MKKTPKPNYQIHFPVLLEEVLTYLKPQAGESYLDLTAGYGGHAQAVLERTLSPEQAYLVDRDQNAIVHLQALFADSGATIVHQEYLSASQALFQRKAQFDLILADLGVSSPHLDIASRGFSLKANGPLDMRMDSSQALTAAEIVNNYSEAELTDVLLRYGEEPRARTIARAIVAHRPLATTLDLATIVARATKQRGHSKIHPATRTFQALRIAVNDELGQLEASLPLWIDLLAPGGRIVIISFHSLEDRLVKQALGNVAGDRYDAVLQLLTKQPVSGSPEEIAHNPRARSAKLRAAAKIKT